MHEGQLALQKVLNESLLAMKLRNPGISLRGFAARLQMNPSAISEILNGKRKVSKKLAKRILEKLTLDPESTQAVLEQFDIEKRVPKVSSKEYLPMVTKVTVLEADSFRSIADWYHFAILSLAETRSFRSDPEWIAERLNITVSRVEAALERLIRLGMFKRAQNGQLILSKQDYRTTDEVVSVALKKAHSDNLELARDSLVNDPLELRDFNAMTMSIDLKKLPEAKKLIREFKEKMCLLLESGHRSEVYKLCIQLFPLSKVEKERGLQ